MPGAKYPNLLHDKGGAGYPYVCFLDADGNLIARQNYQTMRTDGVAAFQTTLSTEVKEFYALRKAAEGGDEKARAAYFMRRFDLGHLNGDELQAAMQEKGFLDEDQRAQVHERLIELRTKECLAGLDQSRKEDFGPYAKKLLEQHKTIGLPEGPSGIPPWYVILEDAYQRRDAKTFEMAFTAMRAAGLRSKKFVTAREKQLEELKAEKKTP